jgi:hypothetical protein
MPARIKFAAAFALSLWLAPVALADELTPEKAADIKHLLEVTGSANIGLQFASAISEQMFKNLKAARPDIPDQALTVVKRELTTLLSEKMTAPGGLMDQMIPIYARHFTHGEIRELAAFYQTPVGRKAIAVLPQVLSESMAAGQRWGQSLVPEIQQRVAAALEREGLLPKPNPK